MHLFNCLQTPPRENWFHYVRREYATAINFSCLITLRFTISVPSTVYYSGLTVLLSSFNISVLCTYISNNYTVFCFSRKKNIFNSINSTMRGERPATTISRPSHLAVPEAKEL